MLKNNSLHKLTETCSTLRGRSRLVFFFLSFFAVGGKICSLMDDLYKNIRRAKETRAHHMKRERDLRREKETSEEKETNEEKET